MADPKPRKKPAKKRAAKPARKPLTKVDPPARPRGEPPRVSRDPAREIPLEERVPIPEPGEPASEEQLLVACSLLDPLAQEVMIAARLAAMPSQREGGLPVNIPRMVRPAWARNLRKLGIFCIPELATHELIAPDGAGVMINHTAATMRQIRESDLWEKAKEMNPELGRLVDGAKTPAQKRAAMEKLAAQLPVEYRVMIDRLRNTSPDELEPS